MDFISSPRDLYNVAMINKVTMQALTTRMVVRCAMFGGTRQYKCMQMLQKLMVKHSIYPPTPLRLVRLVNGKRCEFCNNESPRGQNNLHRYFNTSKAIQCGPFHITENPKPRQIRGSLGLFACYPCMTQVRHQSISGGWSYPCLTRRWHKMFLSASLDHRVHTKQTWSVNRELMHRIFSHPRVLAYPYQVRRFDTLGLRNDRINSLLGDQAGDIFPRDRTEIMQSCSLRDASGDLIGSLINHDNLRDLQQYLKKDDSRTIGYFIDRFVSEAPAIEDYEDFLTAYRDNLWRASRVNADRIRQRKEKKELAVLNKIERCIAAISKIVQQIDLNMIQNTLGTWCRLRPSFRDVIAIKRLLLCYKEEHHHAMHHRITYITDNRELNVNMHKWLNRTLRNPGAILNDDQLAKTTAVLLIQTIGLNYGLPRKIDFLEGSAFFRLNRRRIHGTWTDRSRYRRFI